MKRFACALCVASIFFSVKLAEAQPWSFIFLSDLHGSDNSWLLSSTLAKVNPGTGFVPAELFACAGDITGGKFMEPYNQAFPNNKLKGQVLARGNHDENEGAFVTLVTGGGEVTIKGGTYSSGAIFLKSNVTLNIDATAILKARLGGSFPSVRGRWEGHEASYAAPLITVMDASNITLKGTGKIVGDTRAVVLKNCKNVLFQDLNITCNLRWTNHLLYCEDVVCERLTVRTSGKNTDGLVIDSSKRVKIRNCTFSTGDDCIPIKSGKCLEGVRIGKPSAEIDIRDCVMEKGHGGVVIGSEMSGGVENVTIENVRVRGCGNGAFRLKTNTTRGGFIRNILVNNLQVTDGSPTARIEPNYSLN